MQAYAKFLPSHSTVSVVLSNPCVGPSPRINIYFFLLTTCMEELISTPKIITFLPIPPLGNEKVPFLSNPMSYTEYLYLSISAFFAN